MKIQKKLFFVRFSAKKTHKHTVSKYIQLIKYDKVMNKMSIRITLLEQQSLRQINQRS